MKAVNALSMAIGLSFTSLGAQAAVSSTGCGGDGICTLDELFSGGSITVNDIKFDNFLEGLNDGLVAIDSSKIQVVGEDDGGLDPGPGISLKPLSGGTSEFTLSGGSADDIFYELFFDVSHTGNASVLKDASLDIGGNSIGSDAFWEVFVEIDDTYVLSAIQEKIDGISTDDITSDEVDFASTVSAFEAYMLFDFIDDGVGTGTSGVDDVTFRVSAVPVPAALPLLLSGLGLLGLSNRRRRQH